MYNAVSGLQLEWSKLEFQLWTIIVFLFEEIQNPRDLDQYIVMRDDPLKKFTYVVCINFLEQKWEIILESKHLQGFFSYSCDICGKVMGTDNAMQTHKKKYHNSAIVYVN